jgi:hypothetical protein
MIDRVSHFIAAPPCHAVPGRCMHATIARFVPCDEVGSASHRGVKRGGTGGKATSRRGRPTWGRAPPLTSFSRGIGQARPEAALLNLAKGTGIFNFALRPVIQSHTYISLQSPHFDKFLHHHTYISINIIYTVIIQPTQPHQQSLDIQNGRHQPQQSPRHHGVHRL